MGGRAAKVANARRDVITPVGGWVGGREPYHTNWFQTKKNRHLDARWMFDRCSGKFGANGV